MQTRAITPHHGVAVSPPGQANAKNGDSYPVVQPANHEPTDADLLSIIFDLFAGRTTAAFGEGMDWWNETLQCDLAPQAAAGVALSALSKWPFDQRAGAPGVKALQDELLKRARMLIERSLRDTGEVVL